MVTVNDIEYRADGRTMIGRLAVPDGRRPTSGGSRRPRGPGLDVLLDQPYPRLATPRPLDAANITAKVLVCIGTQDPLIPVGERLMFGEQMDAAGVDWRMSLYGGAQHSFTHPQVDRIDVSGLRSTRSPPSDRGARWSWAGADLSERTSVRTPSRTWTMTAVGSSAPESSVVSRFDCGARDGR